MVSMGLSDAERTAHGHHANPDGSRDGKAADGHRGEVKDEGHG